MNLTMRFFSFAATFFAFSSFAFAHHPMGGKTPTSFMEGILSGIGHPIFGVDHLAFIVAVGLAALLTTRPFLMPLFFIAATVFGVFIHLMSFDLILPETFIALSVLLGGVFVARAKHLSLAMAAMFFAVAGLFHGFAYGEAIFGAETTPIVAYLFGFSITQYLIAIVAGSIATSVIDGAVKDAAGFRIAGGVVCGMGLMILSEQGIAAVFG